MVWSDLEFGGGLGWDVLPPRLRYENVKQTSEVKTRENPGVKMDA